MNTLDLPGEYERRTDIADSTKTQLVNVAKLLVRHGLTDSRQFSATAINDWLLARKQARLQPETIKGNRTTALMLWRLAHELGEAGPTEKVRIIKVPEKIVHAFSREEILRLMCACSNLKGRFRKLPLRRRIYFESFFAAAYDSGLRLGDLLALEYQSIWPSGFVSLVINKTGVAHRAQFRTETLILIEECMAEMPNRVLVWPPFARRKRFYEYFRKIVKKAGVRSGTSKWLRRSAASYIAARHGEIAASDFLGHRTLGLARKNYIDQNIAPPFRPLPPPLTDAG